MRLRIKKLLSCYSRTFAAAIWLVLFHSFLPLGHADSLPAPQGEVLLKIGGKLMNPNVGDQLHLDKQMLESFPAVTFTTETVWSEGPQTFTGVRLSDLFDAAGAKPEEFVAVGLDDYKFTAVGVDAWKYPVIVAYKHNGEYISVRKLGPLRIMFPFDDYPELMTQMNEASSVWQLIELELH